jgi:hypothetical protein
MDANAPRKRSARLAPGGLSIAAAVIGLVAIVAIASSGSTPSGGVERRRPSDGLLDTFISLFLVVLVVSAVLSVVLLSFFSRYRPDGTAPKRRAWWKSLVGLVVAVALIALLVRSSAGRFGDGPTGIVPPSPGGTGEGAAAPRSRSPRGGSRFAGGAPWRDRPIAPQRRSRTCSRRRSTTCARSRTRVAP